MALRFAALAALAVLSSACTYRMQTPAREAAPSSPDNAVAAYEEPFGQSPSRAPRATETARDEDQHAASPGNALGFPAEGGQGAAAGDDIVSAEATEYVEVEAGPGTACYDAAIKAGIDKGTCTLIRERTFLLVGEKAH